MASALSFRCKYYLSKILETKLHRTHLDDYFTSSDEAVVKVVEGTGGRSRILILDVGRAAESLRGLLGLEPRDPDDGSRLAEVSVDLLLGGANIQTGDEHTGNVVGTVLVTVQVKIRLILVGKVWLIVSDLMGDMAGDVAAGLDV